MDSAHITAQKEFPEIRYFELSNTSISANASSLLKDGRLLLSEHLYENSERIVAAYKLASQYDEHAALIPTYRKTTLPVGIFLSGDGSFNWYHWLIEILPRAMLIDGLPERLRNYPVLVPPEFQKYESFRLSFELLNITNDVLILEDDKVYEVANLVYIETPSITPFNMRPGLWPEAADCYNQNELLLSFRAKILDTLNIRPSSVKRRVFLARSNSRRHYDQEKVITLMSELNVETVYPDQLDFSDQVQLFHDAELVIGSSGAAWAGLLFANKACKGVIWTFPEYAQASIFSNIANMVGVDLRFLFFNSTKAVRSTDELYSASYEMDLNRLRNTVLAVDSI